MSRYKPSSERDVDLDTDEVRDSQGRRVDETYVAAVVEAARAVGRPSLGGAGTRSPQVSFRLPAETRARAAEVAQQQGKTVSQLAREALEHYLAAS